MGDPVVVHVGDHIEGTGPYVPRHPILPLTVDDVARWFGVPRRLLLAGPWSGSPATRETPRRSRMHAAYNRRRRNR